MSSAREVASAQAARQTPVATLAHQPGGRPLDAGVRNMMETRFGHDFSNVRVHAGDAAARSANALDARAYTMDSDIVFGGGEYEPRTPRGQRLLAHELAHVAQRQQRGPGDRAEERADRAAAQVGQGQSVSPAQLGAAGPGIHRQPKGDDKRPPPADEYADPAPDIKPFTVPLSVLIAQLPKLQPPTLLGSPKPPAPIIPIPKLTLGSGGSGAGGQTSPLGGAAIKMPQLTGLPLSSTSSGPTVPLAQPFSPAPSPPGSAAASAAPDLPSRIGVTDVWKISFGLRFGLPKAKEYIPGTPPERRVEPNQIAGSGPSALAVSDYQFELMDMAMTGKVPRGFDAVDKGDLIKASFGILATSIAPQLFASLAKKVAGKPGADYKFDLTIDGSFKGGGITFEIPLGKPKKAYRAPVESP